MATKKKKEKVPDITFFHPNLLEVPVDGAPPHLKGYKCKKCGQIDFPKVSPCPSCWGEEFEMIPLSRKGKLYSFSSISIAPPYLKTPYTMAYVDLPEDIRVFAQLEDGEGSFKCDEEVELTTGAIRLNKDGLPITSYKFKQVSS